MDIEGLYGYQIMHMLPEVTVLNAEHVTGDVIHGRPNMFICNTSVSSADGGHWVAIHLTKHGGDYFDSFGTHPCVYNFDQFLNANCQNWSYNDIQLQSYLTNACGHHAVAYCISKMSNLSNSEFLSLFSNDLLLNDLLVSEWIDKCWGIR